METTASQTKEDIVIKKDNQKKSTKEKSKIQTKKATTQSVKQIARSQTGTGKGSSLSGNSSNIETFRSTGPLLSSTGTGSLYGNPSFDTQNFKYSYYTDQIIRKIRSNWRWAEDYGGNLRSVVYFRINRDETVHNISIKESSGNSEFDKNALDTIRRVASFPELPEDYNEESLGVFFEFKWSRN
ncbi:hypothetical protein AGMMS49936_03290 [Endomicrobiia bacterium]|nr:hypothetical protein AGMMS49936_03290 [Endomicrobiia bacterium]